MAAVQRDSLPGQVIYDLTTSVSVTLKLAYTLVQLFNSIRLLTPWVMTPWTAARQASLSITSSRSLLKLMSIKSLMPSNHLILYNPLLLPSSVFLSIRVFSSESDFCIRWPKYWNFSISPSNEYSGLIFFRIDWFDPLAVQGTQESSPTPEFKSINSSALSFPYGPTHIHTWLPEKP